MSQLQQSSPLRLKLFHDVQKVIVNLRLTSKLQLHLVQVGQGILHLQHTSVMGFIFTHLYRADSNVIA